MIYFIPLFTIFWRSVWKILAKRKAAIYNGICKRKGSKAFVHEVYVDSFATFALLKCVELNKCNTIP